MPEAIPQYFLRPNSDFHRRLAFASRPEFRRTRAKGRICHECGDVAKWRSGRVLIGGRYLVLFLCTRCRRALEAFSDYNK